MTRNPFDAAKVPDAAPVGAATFEDDTAAGFGNKIAWMAIHSASPTDVMARLEIGDARRTRWTQGIDAAYGGPTTRVVYVTPPIDGWVLVVGTALFEHFAKSKVEEADVPNRVASLSATLGVEVQFFATHRGVDAHAWIETHRGKVMRAYFVAQGHETIDIGALTDGEKSLAINFDQADEGPDVRKRAEYLEWASHRVDERMVRKVAARWSVDPDALEGRSLPSGWLGTLPR